MQLSRKKRFRRQYGETDEYDGGRKNDSTTISFQPETGTTGYDGVTHSDQYESLKTEVANVPSPTPPLPERPNLGSFKSNDGQCGMFLILHFFID